MIKILILGGGFGGIRCALDLSKKLGDKARITLIDRKGFHLFTPALYEVASAYGVKKDPFAVRLRKTISIPYSEIFSPENCGGGKINFIQAEIAAIDSDNKKIVTRGGGILDYDYLVIALGSQASDFGVPGVKEYAFQFKNLEDGLALNQKINDLIEEISSGVRKPPIRIAVIGAGFTGIEVAAELSCCVKSFARRCSSAVYTSKCERIILLESSPKILPMVSEEEREVIVKRLTNLGVGIMEGAGAEEVLNDRIKLKNGKTIEVDLVIWTAGVKPPDLLRNSLGITLTDNGKVKVDESLEIAGMHGVFAVGDNVEFQDRKTGRSVPALAYIAVDQGKIVAKNIARLISNKKPVPYIPFSGIWIAPIGGKYALAHLWRGINVKGIWGWLLREVVDFRYMLSILSVKNALAVMWKEVTIFTKND